MQTDQQLTGLKSLRIFFSYSTEEKAIVGTLKIHLESLGFEVFLAHEDIEPCVEWQGEIFKNLRRCDIFIPLFSKNFKKSNWTDQETGIAVAGDKFIIPLQVDLAPYGFIGKIQSLRINSKELRAAARNIFDIIRTKSPFEEDVKGFIVNTFITSNSWSQAGERAVLLSEFNHFTTDELSKLAQATTENREISHSFAANSVLIDFFATHKDNMNPGDFKNAMQTLKPSS